MFLKIDRPLEIEATAIILAINANIKLAGAIHLEIKVTWNMYTETNINF